MSPNDPSGLRILIVEDYADGADSLALLLRMDGHDVEVARDGAEALERELDFRPDVVLLDLGLPGMTGYEVARHLVERRPDRTPLLVAVTGYGDAEARRRSAETGIDLHLVKPVEPARLYDLLERFRRVVNGEPTAASASVGGEL
jgi:CheY-like chemotaxis protein